MKHNVIKLHNIANKPERIILGLMSGTSLDGLDMALCSVTGSGLQTKIKLLQFETCAYSNNFKAEIKTIFSKRHIDFEKLCLLNPWIALQHAEIINKTLTKWGVSKDSVDVIASHGQTVLHSPAVLRQKDNYGNATLQIGDGDHLAVATGITVISDFRQKHIAAGGEGAPLACYGDYLLFGKDGEDRILLNIGGIANFTFLPANAYNTGVFSSDTGPGNTLMDAFMQFSFPGKYFDEDAAVAKKGNIQTNLLNTLKQHDFFIQPLPKTTGPELFNLEYLNLAKQNSGTSNISAEDTMATLNKFTADTIADAILKTLPLQSNCNIFMSGGGVHNPLLVQHLKELLPGFNFNSTATLEINPDAKETILFALLANECLCGSNDYLPKGNKNMPAISMGKISFAD